MIDKEKVFDEYMKWVKKISKDFPEKAGFFPREIVNKVCELAEAQQAKNNEVLDLVSHQRGLLESFRDWLNNTKTSDNNINNGDLDDFLEDYNCG